MGLMGKHRWRRFAASMIGVEADDEVAQRQAVLANGLSDAHPSAKRLTPAWRPSSARDLAMPCEDAQVALTAVVVCGHIASVEERGDALEASVSRWAVPTRELRRSACTTRIFECTRRRRRPQVARVRAAFGPESFGASRPQLPSLAFHAEAPEGAPVPRSPPRACSLPRATTGLNSPVNEMIQGPPRK